MRHTCIYLVWLVSYRTTVKNTALRGYSKLRLIGPNIRLSATTNRCYNGRVITLIHGAYLPFYAH